MRDDALSLLQSIKEKFGGNLYRSKNNGGNAKPSIILSWEGPDALQISLWVLSHLHLKRTQAEVLIEFERLRQLVRKSSGRHETPTWYLERAEELHLKIRALKEYRAEARLIHTMQSETEDRQTALWPFGPTASKIREEIVR